MRVFLLCLQTLPDSVYFAKADVRQRQRYRKMSKLIWKWRQQAFAFTHNIVTKYRPSPSDKQRVRYDKFCNLIAERWWTDGKDCQIATHFLYKADATSVPRVAQNGNAVRKILSIATRDVTHRWFYLPINSTRLVQTVEPHSNALLSILWISDVWRQK